LKLMTESEVVIKLGMRKILILYFRNLTHNGARMSYRQGQCFTPHSSYLTPHSSHLTPHISHLPPYTSHFTLHTSHLTPHTSHLTPPTSHLTPPTSHLTSHTSQVNQPLSTESSRATLSAGAGSERKRREKCLDHRCQGLGVQMPMVLVSLSHLRKRFYTPRSPFPLFIFPPFLNSHHSSLPYLTPHGPGHPKQHKVHDVFVDEQPSQ
jgi:hypothetical protein